MKTEETLRKVYPSDRIRVIRLNNSNDIEKHHADIWANVLKNNIRLANYDSKMKKTYKEEHKILTDDEMDLVRGVYLSLDDRQSVRMYIQKYLIPNVKKHMERKANELQTLVDQSRKGFANQFKRMFGTTRAKSNAKSKRDENTPRYFLNATDGNVNEAKVRFAADTCFLLKRFDQALSLYRLVLQDFKEDKAMDHLAATYQQIALCTAFLNTGSDASRREIEHHFELAFQRFQRTFVACIVPCSPEGRVGY